MLYLEEHFRVTPVTVSISAVVWLNVYGSLHGKRKSETKQLRVYVLPSPLLCRPYCAARSLRVMYKSTAKKVATAVFLFHKHKKCCEISKVLIAVLLKIHDLWNCCTMSTFPNPLCLQLQGQSVQFNAIRNCLTAWPWRWHYIPSIRWSRFSSQRRVTPQKT